MSLSNGLEDQAKLRFDGFSNSYQYIQLGNIAQKIVRNDSSSIAPIMMISAGHGFINQSDKYSTDNAGNSLKKYILLKEMN